jgi:hypothetical protein
VGKLGRAQLGVGRVSERLGGSVRGEDSGRGSRCEGKSVGGKMVLGEAGGRGTWRRGRGTRRRERGNQQEAERMLIRAISVGEMSLMGMSVWGNVTGRMLVGGMSVEVMSVEGCQ